MIAFPASLSSPIYASSRRCRARSFIALTSLLLASCTVKGTGLSGDGARPGTAVDEGTYEQADGPATAADSGQDRVTPEFDSRSPMDVVTGVDVTLTVDKPQPADAATVADSAIVPDAIVDMPPPPPDVTPDQAEPDLAPTPDVIAQIPALLLIGGDALSLSDAAVRDHLVALGFSVDFLPVRTVAEAMAAAQALPGHKLLVLATSMPQGPGLPALVRERAVPIVCMKSDFLDNLTIGLAQHGEVDGQTVLNIGVPAHPLAGGRTGDVAIVDQPTRFSWGRPLSSVAPVTIAGQPEEAVIFGIERGTPLASGAAPARRVAWLALEPQILHFTEDAWSLFAAAIHWAMD